MSGTGLGMRYTLMKYRQSCYNQEVHFHGRNKIQFNYRKLNSVINITQAKKKISCYCKNASDYPRRHFMILTFEIPILYLASLHHLQNVLSASSGQCPGRK